MMATRIVKLMMTKTFLTWKRFLRKRRKNLRLKVCRLKRVCNRRKKLSRNLTKMKVKSLKKTTRISSKKK